MSLKDKYNQAINDLTVDREKSDNLSLSAIAKALEIIRADGDFTARIEKFDGDTAVVAMRSTLARMDREVRLSFAEVRGNNNDGQATAELLVYKLAADTAASRRAAALQQGLRSLTKNG